jgi:hypothetical protein
MQLVCKIFGRAIVTVVARRAEGGNEVILQVAALPILHVVRYFTTGVHVATEFPILL